jgi:hypothetical protein
MTPVSHKPPNGASAVDYEQLGSDLARAMLVALRDDNWVPYNQALEAWFFAATYRPKRPVVALNC